METKTVKLDYGEYTDFSGEFDARDLLILTGARGSGKSYPTAKYVSKLLEENENAKFAYMRISDKELATFDGWCQDLNLADLAGHENFKLTRGKPTRGDILLTAFDDEEKLVYSRVIGKCISLESSHLFKSGKYDEYAVVVFEEYTHLNINPETEKRTVFNFLENIESIFRNRAKKIILLCNALKNIPLIDRAIDNLTGDIFKNPLKIRIFRRGSGKITNEFLSYLAGETYSDDNFKVNMPEFECIYTNKKYIVSRHIIYHRKHYIQRNNSNKCLIYNESKVFSISNFCQMSSANEFYYQDLSLESEFVRDYSDLLSEMTAKAVSAGVRYLTD